MTRRLRRHAGCAAATFGIIFAIGFIFAALLGALAP